MHARSHACAHARTLTRAGATQDGAVLFGHRVVPLRQLTSTVMHDLLEQGIRLITYYCREATAVPANPLARKVAGK